MIFHSPVLALPTNNQASSKVCVTKMPKVRAGVKSKGKGSGRTRAMARWRGRAERRTKKGYARFYQRVPRFVLGGFPTTLGAKLRYVDEVSIDPGAAGTAYDTYTLNSIYDPYTGTGGHQPMGTDELFAVYKNATVVGTKMTVTPISSAVTNVNPGAIVLFKSPNVGSLSAASFSPILEQSNATDYSIGGMINTTGAMETHPLTITYSPKQDQGITNPMDENGLRNTASSGPSKPYYGEIYVASIAANDPGAVQVIVELEFLVVFSERVAQSSS